LEITEFKPVVSRIKDVHIDAMDGQYMAAKVWTDELTRRFDSALLNQNITEIAI
jgi:hypothetical protein